MILPYSSADPFEQWNRASSLTPTEKSYLHDQLEHLKGCKGTWDCTVGSAREAMPQLQQHQRYISKRKYSDAFGTFFIKKCIYYTLNTKNLILLAEDTFVPSALQIIRESELGSPSNKRRKKLQK